MSPCTAVYGIFVTPTSLEATVDALISAGLSGNGLSLLMSDKAGWHDFTGAETVSKSPDRAEAGGAADGLVGLLLGLGALVIPGAGPLVAAGPLMAGRHGALLTLTYLGAIRSIPSYNVMGLAKASLEANVRFLAADLGPKGVRVNAISAGPIKTLAAAGIAGFRRMLGRVAEVAPLRRNVTLEDVGNAAAFLCSDLAAGITGEVLYVDGGFNTVGMSFPQEAEG